MSLYKDASLVMIPSAYKDGKLYSIRPTDGSGDFDFSRGSNLAATRVASSGYIQKGRENLLLQSNQFDTTPWALANTTITSGQTGYDGSSDAWLLEVATTGNARRVQQTHSSSGLQIFSVYVKAGTTDWIILYAGGLGGRYFNVSTGAQGTTFGGTPLISNIEAIGATGYYRCSIVVNGTNTGSFIYPVDNDGSPNGTAGANIYIQDAQLEQGLVATDYIETGTSAAQSGILEDMPRLDYSGGASCPSLLLEPQRSNTFPNSEYLSGYSLARTNGTNNSATSPEGIDNAFKLYADTQTGAHYMRLSYTKTSDAVLSVFAKKGEETSFAIGNASFSQGVVFNLENGTITSESGGTGTIEDMGNDWYRCSYHRTAWADWQYIALRGNNTAYTGDGSSGIYLYGIQFEDGSYPTSYIPTYGTSQTRSADNVQQNTLRPNNLSGSAFTYFLDMNTNTSVAAFSGYFNEVDSGGNYKAGFVWSNGLQWRTPVGGGNYYVTLDSVVAKGDRAKMLVVVDGTERRVYYNGSLVITIPNCDNNGADTDGIVPYYGSANVNFYSGLYNQILVFDTALTDSECIALTTL